MTDEDKATVKYLRNSPSDSLKKEAADLIERLDLELKLIKRRFRDLASTYND